MDELLTGEEQYRSITKRLPRFTREQEAELVLRARTGDPVAREELITSCLNYVGFIANWYARYVYHDEYLDLVGIGNLVIVENLEKALAKDNPCGYLRKMVKAVVLNYCITHASLVTRPTYSKPTYTNSLDTPVYANTLTQEPVVVAESPDYSWLYQALERLPKAYREVLTRHYGLYNSPVESLYEMSRKMSRSVKGSVAYLTEYRALRLLRQILAQQEGKTTVHAENK
jgi:DNA-directed RNA polymerase specialized sigma24 family protein